MDEGEQKMDERCTVCGRPIFRPEPRGTLPEWLHRGGLPWKIRAHAARKAEA